MSLDFNFPSVDNAVIKVIGVGGGGGNALNSMFDKGIKGVDFVICNTDGQALLASPIQNKVRLGPKLTAGEGCGADPMKGSKAAEESIEDILTLLGEKTRMVFVTAGMGGGTGTGAAPVIARIAKEMGILTVGIVTTPFTFEGAWRMDIARKGIAELERHVDSLLVINNSNLLKVAPKKITKSEAYKMADKVLWDAAKGIAEIITVTGYVNVDFADVSTIMRNSGTALMGVASAKGEDRAMIAIEEALNSPLLENINIHGATGILINVCASEESLTLEETEIIGNYVQKAAGDQARIISGEAYDPAMGDELRVTVIATGFNKTGSEKKTKAPEKKTLIINEPVKNRPFSEPRNEFKPEPRNDFDLSVKTEPEIDFYDQRAMEPDTPFFFEAPVTKPLTLADIEADDKTFFVPAKPKENLPKNEVVFQTETKVAEPEDFFLPIVTKRTSPEERLAKLKQQNLDPRNNSTMRTLENEAAFKRQNVDLSVDIPEKKKQLSKLTLDVLPDGGVKISDNNPFWNDITD